MQGTSLQGIEVFIEGTLKTDKWTDNVGVRHQKTKVLAEFVRFLGAPKTHEAPPPAEPEGWEPGIDG